MEFIFVLSVVIFQIGLINFFEVAQVVRTFRVDAFVDDEVLAVFLVNEGMGAVGTAEVQRGKTVHFFRRKPGIADFAKELSFRSIILVQIEVRRLAAGTAAILGNITVFSAGYWFYTFAVAFLPIRQQILIGPVLGVRLDDGEFIHLELLIFG